ncbi:MAG: TonB-dependent receptor [Candidatus Neomarinimicrobiota bacterium]|nr:MAG: TonB-dependent receptor [Candidatus Neomarinimicrobiota bacterium]
MVKRLWILGLILIWIIPASALGQGSVTGRVTDIATGRGLPGANVYFEGTPYGAATDLDGGYAIYKVPAGEYTLVVEFIGYRKVSEPITVQEGQTLRKDIQLQGGALELSALEVMASRATRETPVAYSDIPKAKIEMRLASRDIPMVLNTTPSVYATQQGGGAGDARVNVRGFNQRNVAIMINGVPVNDMENGWVYWSNWDGVADATSSIQMQRGLSAVNLAAPSIGGTMNIITDPTARKAGGLIKQEVGSGAFLKTTVNFNTGMVGDKFAASGTIVRKTADGVIDKTWTDAWAYYLGLSYQANKNNRFEFFALGAPQRHGQMRYAQNIAAYDHEYAKDVFDESVVNLDADANGEADVFETFKEAGRTYNENWNTVSPTYKGKQYFYMYGDRTEDRYSPDFLNESENYYHKPQVNLNWYLTMSEKTHLSSIFYYSGGSGGGTGTYGDMIWDYSGPSRKVDFDATIAMNQGNETRKGAPKPTGESVGFLRNSINRQWTIGAISKLNHELNEKTKVQLGIDWRTAEIEHAREVRDLLGGDYAVNGVLNYYTGFYENKNTPEFDPSFKNEFDWVYTTASDGSDSLDYAATYANAKNKNLGDIIDYHNTNTVDWLGVFAQSEYKANRFSLYGMLGYSMVKYGLVDHFKKAEYHDLDYVTATDDGELSIESDWITAVQFKTGGLYKVNTDLDAFLNFGYVEKVPILDNIIDDVEIALAPDPTNEKFISTEIGLNYRAMNGKLAAKLNLYNTMWKDRNMVKPVTSGQGSSGDTDIIFLTGLNQTHNGVELELAYQPVRLMRFDFAYSYGSWLYTDDVIGTYKDVENNTTTEYKYSIKDLRVGDMPQTIYSLTASVYPVRGLVLSATYNYYDRYWAEWDPQSRVFTSEADADREQSWQVPSYGKLNFHSSYVLPFKAKSVTFKVFFHVFNVTDALYVQDAVDNSQYNAFTGDGKNHKADDAEVYIGAPRTFNSGLQINF